MTITRISVYEKALRLNEPYFLSGGRLRFDALDSTFVRIDCHDGVYGYGESCPWGHTYLPAFGAGARAALSLLAPALVGESERDIERQMRRLDVVLPGHAYAKSALDMALWDIAGKRAGLPLYTLFGGAEGDHIEVNSSIPTASPDEMVQSIKRARAMGYNTHSAKIGGADAALDIERIKAIEAARQASEKITFDVNRAWTPAIAIQVMNASDSHSWFEQPCETLDQCMTVRAKTHQPIMLDECLHRFGDHLRAWKLGACEGVKAKPNRLGGLTACRQIRDFGVAVGWQMHIEDVGGTVLADTASMHIALSTPVENRLASWLCHPHLVDDYAAGTGARNVGGRITLADAPGIGVEPPSDWLGSPQAQYD